MTTKAQAKVNSDDRWLTQTLVDAGVLQPSQADHLQQGSLDGESSWKRAVREGFTSDYAIVQALVTRFKVKPADVGSADPRASGLLPESMARKYRVVVLRADDRSITVATADPRDLDLEENLRFITGRRVSFEVAPPDAINKKLDEIYRPEKAINALLEGLNPSNVESIEEVAHDPDKDPTLEAPMTKLVDAMISEAVRDGASDIHAEPLVDGMVIRYRIDGVLKEVMRLPANSAPVLARRIKILAKLDVTDPLHPHDGRAAVRVDGKAVDLRVATVPVARRGEKVVIRILDKSNLRANIPDLRLPETEEETLRKFLGHREGMILVTGPTGSGKTTTLYAMINELRTGKVNIITVEDPVEYDVPGISQLQVNEAQGFTFSTALRSVLRQDPDILLVGEIRDAETSTIAIQAGLSGHLVLSTLHTNDAPSAVVRLRDLGTDSFKIASVLKGIVAQRLVRRLCQQCAQEISVDDLPREARPPAGRPAMPRKAVGCKVCVGTGFKGRMSVLEIMPVNDAVAHKIEAGALPDELLAAARPLGMRTLWESGLERVWAGHTSIEEVVRVLGEKNEEAGGTKDIIHGSTIPDAVRAEVTLTLDDDAKPHILVADDDPQMRRLIRSILERDGYRVTEAGDGLDALESVESGQFALMMLDIDMPRLDGLGVLEELRTRIKTAGVPVIVLTARTDDTEIRVLELGAQDFLSKPVQPQSLQARVKAVLRRAKLV